MQIKRLFPCVLSASVALGMLSPSNAVALGLGDIEVHSSLNQPLNAEIKLFSLEKGDFESLNIKLASPEIFAREDLDRLAILSKLNFELIRLNGVPHVRIQSHEPIIEPFLNFLVEANWSRGRLIREYTLLLDPPDLTAEKPAPLSAPVTTHAVPARSRVTAEPVVNRQYSQVTREGSSITYGATARNDTLWKIAREIRPDSSVSIFQVMMALLKANPDAFYHNNINSLKAGYILRLDDVALFTAISKKQASEEYKLQNQQWEAIKQGKAKVAGKSNQSIDSDPSQAVPESKVMSDASSESESQARLELAVPDDGVLNEVGASTAELAANVEKLQHDLGLALENSQTTEKENTLLLNRLAELETQVNELSRLLSIESETLSNIQNREVDAVRETEPLKDHVPKVSVAATEQKATVTPSVVQQDQQKEETKPESLLGGLLKDPTALGLVAAVGLGLLALGAIVMRRRSRDDESFEDDNYAEIVTTLPLSEDAKSSGDPAQFGTPVNDGSDLRAETITTEQSAIADEDMQLDYEIDPLDEADVYIAYRRYPQAEDLLKEAIQIDPDRNKLHVKLLEIYAATDDQDAFIAQAELLKSSLKEDEDYLWDEVSAMAAQVCPGHALFQNGEQITLLQEDEVNQLTSFDADALDESSPLLTEEIELTGDEKIFEEELIAESMDQSASSVSSKDALDVESENDNSIAFEEGLGAGLAPLVKNTEESSEELASNHAKQEEDKNETLLDERMVSLSESLQNETAATVTAEPGLESKSEKEVDMEGVSLVDGDFLIPETPLSDDSDDDWLSKMDEIGTRLDLARAYIDMGDEAGAREILDDVLEKGDEQQKKDALSLMQQLS